MDETEKPNLSLGDLAEIADQLHEMDGVLWEILRPMLMRTDINENLPVSGPRPPKLSARIYLVLSNYSSEAFHNEAQRYRRYPPNPNFSKWLAGLAQGVEDHAIDVVRDIELSDPKKSLAYHGVGEDEMRRVIKLRLREEMEDRYQVEFPPSSPIPLPPDVQKQMQPASSGRMTTQTAATVRDVELPATDQRHTTRRAVIETLLETKGWSVLDWANEANVAHATAMDFLQGKTRPYRSTRLKLAEALGISVDKLPR